MNYLKFAYEWVMFKTYETYLNYFYLTPLVTDEKFNVDYYYNSTKYTICFPNKGRMCPFKKVEDADGKNVTMEVKRYAGPQSNFHMIPTTPKMIGFTSLTFTMKNGTVKTFGEEDVIFY